ncbi:MAG: glycoside hydrolase family 13 protein [Ruminococcaceae bacterium]|nr:glycoside hydrolase family 13 protein [Oscillospiraceae bacterium]
MTEFNSRKLAFKAPFGAVAEDEKVVFFVKASSDVEGMSLAVSDVLHNVVTEFPMTREPEGFRITHSFAVRGLYFYCFRLNEGISIYNAGGAEGFEAPAGAWFQQTVYAKNYKAPKGFAGGIMYQIFPDRFNIGSRGVLPTHFKDRKIHNRLSDTPDFLPDANGEVKNNDYFGGTLLGIEEKLGYLKKLGVSIIYLNPICEAHANHRYNTADYRKVDPQLGTNDDLKSLCKRAKEEGIKIILDGVFSHTGDDSVYFNRYGRYDTLGAAAGKESKYAEWYKYDEARGDYVYWWGFPTLPEVNELTPSYADFICGKGGVLDLWFSLGASGVRLDVADELPDEFIRKIRETVKRNGKDLMLLGEVWEDASKKYSYGEQRGFLYGDELDSVMNYPFCNAVLEFIRTANAEEFAERIMTIYENYPKVMLDNMMNLLTTHDVERAINRLVFGKLEHLDKLTLSEINMQTDEYLRGVEMVKLAYALLYALPGIPSVYYGDEIGMTGFKDPFNRCYMKWRGENLNLRDFMRELGKERLKHPKAFSHGELIFLRASGGAVAFLRKSRGETVLFALNRSEIETEIEAPNGKKFTLPPWRHIIAKI